MVASDIMEIVEKKRYQHRLCLDGTPLNYYAVVGRKQEPVSDTFIAQYQ
jgi:hypothetical protein